jgi:predicted RNA-binding Zn ribbon-like protein
MAASEEEAGAVSSPAAGELELVRAFVNSVDLEAGVDELADPAALAAWLAARGLAGPGERLRPADLARAVELREALRALLLANAGHGLAPGAVSALDRAAARSRLAVRFDPAGRATLEPEGSGLDRAVGRLLAAVHTAMVDGTWPRLKACANDTCQWAFYDRSKNRSGRWCTMQACGNTLKARAYRRRRAAPDASSS